MMLPVPPATRWRHLVTAALVLIFLITTPVNTAQSEEGVWSRQDLDRVADAAVVAAAATSDANSHAFMLLELADALIRSGNIGRAKAIVLQTGEILGSPADFAHSPWASRVVEKLAQLGDVSDAEALADAATGDDTHATLLGKIGAAQARAGDVAGALRTVEKIASLPDVTQTPNPAIANPKIVALVRIGGAFNDRGETETALKIAERLPNDNWKINLLSRVGKRLCVSSDPGQAAKGRLVAEQTAHIASTTSTDNLMPYEKRNWVIAAVGALGTCAGPNVAISFLHNTLPTRQLAMASSMIADNFAESGEASLARAVAPAVDPDDLDSLLDSAKRSLKMGDSEAAKATAMQASATATKLYRTKLPPDQFRALSEICGLLIKLHSYDTAIESTLPIDPITRAQFYVSVVRGEITDNDATAVARTVPATTEALKALTSADVLSQQMLTTMTLALARGRYEDEARQSFAALVAVRNASLAVDPRKRGLDSFAGVRAVMGDLSGALAEADRAGPLTAKPNGIMPTIMSFANATSPPTKGELENRLRQVQSALPPIGPGPKAGVLASIASDLAFVGNIDAAFQVETGLEGEARDILQSTRDTTLAVISDAQGRANDSKSSLATALRIEQPLIRWKPLLRLAAIPPNR
jgi:hypothetical protein